MVGMLGISQVPQRNIPFNCYGNFSPFRVNAKRVAKVVEFLLEKMLSLLLDSID